MKIHSCLSTTLAAGAFLLTGTVVHAQAAQAPATAAKTKAAATATVQGRDAASGMATGRRQAQLGPASGRQDQFGHASGLATGNAGSGEQSEDKSMGSAHATESMQKKHIAGVKYEDRTAAQPRDAQSGQDSSKGIQEKGLAAKTSGPAQSNKMAIKENGLSSKPAAKPKP